ncbi:MAG: tRNA 2-thiouridine(34) synthase MnmA [Fusobacteriaceae bacterium]
MSENKKVVIGMSGGVDSSTSAYLLKNQGFQVYGVTLTFDPESKNEDFEDAKKICEKLDIEHRVINMSAEFNSYVVDNFIEEYSKGSTPSPCVVCDEKVKFHLLFKVADEIGAQYVATGHYAKVEKIQEFHNPSLLKMCTDRKKDQSYMLYRLKPSQLERILFPLRDLEKFQVREIARHIGLEVHDKKDSQGICFAKEGYIPFLQNRLGDKIKKGNFILKDGTVLGQHQGYQLYTLGQRRGLGITLSRAYFITNIDPIKNEITLGEYGDLMRDRVELLDFTLNISVEQISDLTLIGRPRFSSQGFPGKLEFFQNKVFFRYLMPNPQNAPGQHLVLYYKDFVLGGGKISL